MKIYEDTDFVILDNVNDHTLNLLRDLVISEKDIEAQVLLRWGNSLEIFPVINDGVPEIKVIIPKEIFTMIRVRTRRNVKTKLERFINQLLYYKRLESK